MGRSRGPGVALAWPQTAGVGFARPSCSGTVVGLPVWAVHVKEVFFLKFLPKLEIPGGARVGRGSKARTKALVTCSGPAFIPMFPVLVWLEEKEARARIP